MNQQGRKRSLHPTQIVVIAFGAVAIIGTLLLLLPISTAPGNQTSLVTAFFTAVSFLPQAIKTVKTRQTAGLSLLTYLFLFLGSLSWFIYGFYLTDYPLMITNSLTTIFTGIILYLIFSETNSKYN